MVKKIILASGSPRRKEILENVGLTFTVAKSSYEEDMSLFMEPEELAVHLSSGKATDVARQHQNSVIIAADTFIVLGDTVLGKPHTPEITKATLELISGQMFRVVTGYTIIDTATEKHISKAVVTNVYIKKLSEEEIDAYIATGEPLDKAGAFGIQGRGALFVEKIEGDYFNVVGLPLFSLVESLKEFEITPM